MNYRPSYYITHPWEIIKEFIEYLHCFYQRGKYGYSYMDVWNLDYYLSSWLPKALRDLKKCNNSYPNNSGMTKKEWHKLLDLMAKGFENMDEVPMKNWMKEDAKRRKYRELWSYWFWNLWD